MNVTTASIFIIPTLLLFFLNLPFLSLRNRYYLSISSLLGATALGVAAMVLNQTDAALQHSFTSNEFFPALHIDALSALIYTMIGIIGLVVVRYSKNYLDGEPKHASFVARLATTIAFVQLLVISGNLTALFIAWVGTSFGLHRLLLFYPERTKARLAARKKFIIARFGDLSLLAAFILIYQSFGTTELPIIFEKLKSVSATTPTLELAGILLVITACLKSVQIPFHGWLMEVMEAPTPVSALLHAGLLNAGPFLVLRFAQLIDITSASTILIGVGAISALFGAIAASTQSSVKTTLAYSSVGHMGFTLFICGLGVYPAALLHLVAHSFYKAHAFLSSGSLVETVQTSGANTYDRRYKPQRILVALVSSVITYVLASLLWYNSLELSFQLLVISWVIFLGILSLHINTIDSTNSNRSIAWLMVSSFAVISCFYLFEQSFSLYLGNQIPSVRDLSEPVSLFVILLMALFTTVLLSQVLISTRRNSTRLRKLEIHFRNGLYLNHFMNRLMRI